MAKIEPRVLRGFRDYLPSRMIPRQEMLRAVEATFQRFGYAPLMTPALEYLDVLTGKYGEEGDSLLYRFQDQGGRDVALRYDLTVPLARVVAQYPDITLPFRRYQIAPVWRAEKPSRGRFREFVQCDGDIVGSASMVADAEVVLLACELFEALKVESFVVRVNTRKVLSGLMARIGVTDPGREAAVLRTVDKLPKIGEEETARLLRDESGLEPAAVREVLGFVARRGDAAEVLEALRAFFGGEEPGRQGVEDLTELFEILRGAGAARRVEIDLSIARGLNYYTGTIYEAFLGELPGIGAVLGGGRYDGLIGVFKGQDIPAVGVSLGVDRLLEGLVELKLLEERRSVAAVSVTVFDADTAPHAAKVARDLRAAGIACELFPSPQKMGKQLRHAERLGHRWVVVVGPDEIARGEVAVKDLETSRQESVRLEALAGYLSKRLEGAERSA